MSQMKRHIGRLKNTDRKIVVIYMQIPGKDKSALIVDTDALPDQFHEFLMNVVESEAAQRTVNLAEVLDRRASPDSGMNLMNSLHRRGFMRPEPIDNIIMFPRPNMPFPLSKVIELTKKDNAPAAPAQPVDVPQERFNQFTENMNIDNKQYSIDVAKTLLYDAELLQQEVIRKRNKAYDMAPGLRPRNEHTVQNQFRESDNSSSFLPSVLPETSAQSSEYKEIIARAQEHLDRATTYREEHGETQLASGPEADFEEPIVIAPKKKPTRPKKKA